MALERIRKNLGALDPQIYSTVLDGRNRGLRDARELGKLALAQFLKLAQDADRLAYRDLDMFFCRMEFFHFMASGNRGR